MPEYINKCGDCIHAEVCERIPIFTEFSRDNPAYCKNFKNAADVAPVVHGRWRCGEPCPVCGEDRFKGLDADIWSDWEPPFCPNCGAHMDADQQEEHPDWQLYTKYRGETSVEYRYGPEWQGTALFVDGGYKTPEEAKAAWLREWKEKCDIE